MDHIPDPAEGGGNLTEYLLALHANTVGKASPPNKDAAERLEDEPAGATLGAGTHPQSLHATLAFHDAARPTIPGEHPFSNPGGQAAASAASLPMGEEPRHLPATIAPSQMFITESTFQSTLPPAGQAPFQTGGVEQETVLPGIESRQSSVGPDHGSSPSSNGRGIEARSNEFLVTLPMLASTRNLYVETIRSNKSTLDKYSRFFTAESAGTPDDQLISEVDDIFRRLHEHCDLPQFADSIPPLSTEAMMRHATGTNSKFSFVYELFMGLKDTRGRILVLSQPGVAAKNLEAICQTAQIHYTELDRYVTAGDNSDGLSVILGTTEMEVFDWPTTDLHAVILFDSTARQVWRDRPSDTIVLSLVVANSIEHIDLQLSHDHSRMDELERRNAIGFALAVSKGIISSPDSMLEPNELAGLFADFIKEPAHGLDWEPIALPAQFLDYYLTSQALGTQLPEATAQPNGRKRPLDGDERVSTPMKRARTERPTLTQASYLMSDLLRDTLASYAPRPEGSSQTVEVTIDQLEWLVSRISRVEEDLREKSKIEEQLQILVKRTEQELNSYKKTVTTLQPKYMQAVSERGQFEIAKNAVEQRAARLEEELEKSRAETNALREKLTARTPSELEAKYEAAQAERERLEKKLQSAAKERDFFRDRFQEGMGSATELASEINDLKAQIQHLERKASDNTVRVHEINSKNTAEESRRQREESRAYIAQLEQQVEQTRKELQTVKNGRRETRATSVPRSPRLGVMSPRTRGGNTSRGNSPAPFDGSSTPSSVAGPVPGMTFYQPPGSHPRFSHLRE